MIWMLAAIVVVTIGVMAVIDAYFEGIRDSNWYIIVESYGKELNTVDDDIWWNSFVLYENSRGKNYPL